MKIKLNDMQFHSYIGFYPAEREVGQDITVNLTLTLPDRPLETYLSDDLTQTVNYGDVYDLVTAMATAKNEIKLIETLAAQMIQAIHQQFPNEIEQINVRIKKHNLPINGILDSAEIELVG
ncbi:dihydroneopterin aldolase [Weissella viridescens]|uniref:7,8-dihydroneopterin aldolase n=1 Tax=Weissella viridescens TaxID=1629 RepID=A0A3P2RCK0_WEIVI|nr:dihydroneopterin aldolase [Weissella viridescens]RRG18377.1 dihydroneopterin aldolase [Weissella viridescens]